MEYPTLTENDILAKFSSKALHLLDQFHWVFNFRTIDILLPGVLGKIPLEFLSFFQSIEDESWFHNILNLRLSDGCSSICPITLVRFVELCRKLRQDHIQVYEECSSSMRQRQQNSVKKWPEKKIQEVSIVSKFVGELSTSNSCELIVDIGSGLGYLSSELAEKYGIPVIAVESNSAHVTSAQNLKSNRTNVNVTQLALEITSNIVSELYPHISSYNNICITGLHTCGDLSPWSLKLFLEDPKYKVLAIVPCCYHKMKDPSNFPLSDVLKNQLLDSYESSNFICNVHFLRLASQRLGEHFLDDLEKETNFVFHRSVLELYIQNNGLTLRKTKRRGRKGGGCNFADYISKCVGEFGGFSIEGGSSSDIDFHQKHLNELYLLNFQYSKVITGILALQGAIQSIAENLILFDRLLFLRENDKVEEVDMKRIIFRHPTPSGVIVTTVVRCPRGQEKSIF